MTTIKITNQDAADEARALSLDVIETVLGAFARLPESVPVGAALASVHIRLREVETRPFRVQHPYETAELTADHNAMAGADHELAVTELTCFRTTELREDLTIEQTTHRREVVLADLAERREKLARPLGLLGSLFRGRAEARRAEQRAEQVNAIVRALTSQPLAPPTFEEVTGTILHVAGLAPEQVPGLKELQEQGVVLHREVIKRWETILMLVWEAIATEDSGADAGLDMTQRRARFNVAKKARRQEEAATEVRLRQVEARKAAERAAKRAQIDREIRERQAREQMYHRSWEPTDKEQPEDDGPSFV
ncbi:hypothetical protein [Brevibacterium sp. W7.2]|uniref:hypothetical protein n=1 Tax=Brevibacterium sp. W7.2 TaxID=2823518 RepID=UPI001BA9C838|nr:hypothetical protein [Brevibacterium sp. W7.2]